MELPNCRNVQSFKLKKKTEDLGNDDFSNEFNEVCLKINPNSKPSDYIVWKSFENWYSLIRFMSDEITAKTNQIFLFQEKLDLEVIDRLSRAESVASDRLFIQDSHSQIFSNQDLSFISKAIIEISTFLNEARILFMDKYKEHQKEYTNQYYNQRVLRNKNNIL